jgi:endonuclease G
VNIVQHPDGRPKEVSLRENELVARNERVLLYEADTLPGSSGSPVFNDLWEIVALHHYGDPSAPIVAPGVLANEGIRISAIVTHLEALLPNDGGAFHRALARVLDVGLEPAKAPDAPVVVLATGGAGGGPAPDRRIVLAPTLASPHAPTAPAAGSREKVTIDEDYTNRRGYDRDFLAERLELPELTRGQSNLAPLLDDRHRVTSSDYQHFSIVMNKRTRMAFFTAVNIDGASWRDIDRDTGQPKEVTRSQGGLVRRWPHRRRAPARSVLL